MSFDLRPYMPERPLESQLAEGGVNAHANCVPAEHLAVLQDLEYVDTLEPQDITNALFPPDGIAKGGMSFEAVVDYIKSRPDAYPNLPTITVQNPSNLLVVLELYGKDGGFPVVISLCVDGPTVLAAPCSSSTIGHAVSIVAHLPNDNWIIRNPWTGLYNVINTSQDLLAAYEGGLTVFGRSVADSLGNTGRSRRRIGVRGGRRQ